MTSLKFVRHQPISLKQHPEFSENWLQKTIASDPSILGLGELELIDRERVLDRSGRLDLLLSDGDSTRYEVEIMLGQTDPSHIIRCIEYWDLESRRYPAYDHVAVLIAEDITSRFLNIINLMAGNIPIIAIQLSALQVGDQLVLNFVTVLNQTNLRRDDETKVVSVEVDRAYWDSKVGQSTMKIADCLMEMVNRHEPQKYRLKYLKAHVGISEERDWRNQILILPKKEFLHFQLAVSDPETWMRRIEEVGLVVSKRRTDSLRVTVSPSQFDKYAGLIGELVQASLSNSEN